MHTAMNTRNAHVSSLYCSTRLYFCLSDITTCVRSGCSSHRSCVGWISSCTAWWRPAWSASRRECSWVSISWTLDYVPFRVFHYNCIGTVYCLPSTSIVVLMPQHRCHNLSSSSWGGWPSAVWLLLLFFLLFEIHFISSSVYGIMFWIVPLFYTILSCCRSKH